MSLTSRGAASASIHTIMLVPNVGFTNAKETHRAAEIRGEGGGDPRVATPTRRTRTGRRRRSGRTSRRGRRLGPRADVASDDAWSPDRHARVAAAALRPVVRVLRHQGAGARDNAR